MRHESKPVFLFSSFVIILLVFSHSKSVRAQEVEDQKEFDYSETSGRGPAQWGDLKKEWATCKNGTMQSPIPISNDRIKLIIKSGELKTNYKPCNATAKNRGHDIAIKWRNYCAGGIKINGTDYFLEQAHWHTPSEHTINGRRYDLELHMVHESLDPNVQNKTAVIGLLYQIGLPDRFLSKFLNKIMTMGEPFEEREIGVIDPNEITMGSNIYYRYMGSLTTPPCTEGVIWTIYKKIATVARSQIKALRMAVHDNAEANARPLQPINNRPIQLYVPKLFGVHN